MTDERERSKAIYEAARFTGIPAADIDRFLGTMKACGYELETARPEALRTTTVAALKGAIGGILLKIVNRHEPYYTNEGYTRWGFIQGEINSEIDQAFAVSPLLEKP